MNFSSEKTFSVWNLTFLEPIFLVIWLLSIFITITVFYYWNKKNAIEIWFFSELKSAWFSNSSKHYFNYLLIAWVHISFFILFANPHFINVADTISKNGIDIAIALDISKSMEADDLQPKRIRAAKKVISEFVAEIQSDRLWLVVFAWKPYSSLPLSYDYALIQDVINKLNTESLNQNISWFDGTAIWDALLLSAKILENTPDIKEKKREKIIIILTDWDANRWVDPILASKSVSNQGIKIYTIWVWSKQWGNIEIQNWPFLQKQKIPPLNETSLREIARIWSGKFFRATSTDSLARIFNEIAKLEKTEIETKIEKSYTPAYSPFILIILLWIFMLFSSQYIYKS